MKMRLSSELSVIFLFIVASFVSCQNPVNYRLSSDVVPSIYDLHITVDLENLKFSGIETIHIHANQPTTAIELHALDLSIDDVLVIEGENAIPITATNYNNETQIFSIGLGQSLITEREYKLQINFEGEIKDDMKGLYRSSYYENQVVKYMATTFSAASYARKIFPCFDEPAIKAKFHLAISNRDIYATTLANTKVSDVETQELENGEIWKTTTFEPTPVLSSYLLAFAVSEFRSQKKLGSPEFSVYSSSSTLNSMTYALDIGGKALKALEEYVGHNYTLDKMDFIAIDDFLMGAMENWGLVSFKSSRIMNSDGKRNLRKVQEIINIIAHELAHMFFGNQVTCEYWDNVWLNEGFASYLESVIADKIQPQWRILDYFVVNRMHSVMMQDAGPKTHAMTRPVNTIDDINKIYDFVAYPKAASVIRMMEHIMKPEIFQKALNVYIDERSYKTATDRELYEILERVRRNESETFYPPIPDIFSSWSNNPGYPILNVEFFPGNQTAKVSQELFVPFINSTAPSSFYVLYNHAASSNGVSGFVDTSPTNWIHGESESSHALDNTKVDESWVIFNVQQTGYYRVNYDNQNWKAIIDELNNEEKYNSIHALNRAQLLDDSFNLARYDYLDFSVALNMLKYLRHETELVPLTAGFKAIEFLIESMDEQKFYKDLRDILLSIVDDVYVRINNLSIPIKPEDEDYHVLTKLHVNLFACKIGAKSCLTDATRKLFLIDLETKQMHINERPYLYCGALGDSLASLIWVQLKRKILNSNGNEQLYRDNQEEFNEIFYAFTACDSNPDRIQQVLNDIFFYNNETSSYENVSRENALQVVSNLIKTSSAHRSLMMKFYLDNFEAVNEKVPFKETLSTFAKAIFTGAHLTRFSSLVTAAGLTEKETLSEIEENIRWVIAKAPEIGLWVENEKGAAMNMKFSIMAFVTLVFVMLL